MGLYMGYITMGYLFVGLFIYFELGYITDLRANKGIWDNSGNSNNTNKQTITTNDNNKRSWVGGEIAWTGEPHTRIFICPNTPCTSCHHQLASQPYIILILPRHPYANDRSKQPDKEQRACQCVSEQMYTLTWARVLSWLTSAIEINRWCSNVHTLVSYDKKSFQ